ncbi:DUF4177 domain-containing protein [Qingshengfaniella alkalisoli]|nr:DUF4177 domain-containing protein [Qingshengfaniella alkalisoli]
MTQYEYKVLPAPARSDKIKGVKSAPDRFAATLSAALNEQAGNGWEFIRAETLPHEERQGLTGTKSTFQTVLVFRRPTEAELPQVEQAGLRLLEKPETDVPDAPENSA